MFWGTVNPLEGKKALDDLTRQVEEYGAKAFKFYNVRYEDAGPVPWRMSLSVSKSPSRNSGS